MIRLLFLVCVIATTAAAAAPNCVDCHADKVETLAGTPHAVLHSEDNAAPACTQCHGAAEAHMANPFAGGVVAFANESTRIRSEACGSCHSDAHIAGNSAHELAGVACNDCHSVHGMAKANAPPQPGFEKLDTASAICAECHADVLVQFSFSKHHRLAENSVTCIDCHDPHAKRASPLSRDANEKECVGCHTDKAGPFLFEHDANQIDGCLACHASHGSANRHLLHQQAVGEMCFGCHAAMPQFHLGFAPVGPPRFGGDTVCTNCHVTIHGSNLDAAFLK